MIRLPIHAFIDLEGTGVNVDLDPTVIDDANRIVLLDTDSEETCVVFDGSAVSPGHTSLIEVDRDDAYDLTMVRALVTTTKGECTL